MEINGADTGVMISAALELALTPALAASTAAWCVPRAC
jgi:hypothetical protein